MKSTLALEVREWAESIIDEFCANGFDEAVKFHDSEPWKDNTLRDWIDENTSLLDKYQAEVYNGASKVCIVFNMKNWVIKTNYQVRNSTKITYGELEVRNYKLAEEAGIEKFFVKTYELGWRDEFGMYFYIQEKAAVDSSEVSGRFYDYVSEDYDREDFEDEDDYMDAVDERVCEMNEDERLFAVFGCDDDVRALVDFINRWDINDLHEYNFGISSSTGKYLIIDFSGY